MPACLRIFDPDGPELGRNMQLGAKLRQSASGARRAKGILGRVMILRGAGTLPPLVGLP